MRAMVVVLGLLAAAPIQAADWPMFLGPWGNGQSPEVGLLRQWPERGLPRLWERKVGSGYAGPAIVGDRLVLFHRLDDHEMVECLDAATGATKWRHQSPSGYVDDFNFDDGPRGVPAIDADQVFTLGAEGRLTCLQLATGAKVWSRDLGTDYPFRKGYFGVGTSPLVVDDLVVVNIGSKGAGVVALDRQSGKERWKASDDEASYSTPVVAEINGAQRLVFLTRAGLLVLDPKNGSVVHRMPFRARIQASVNAATPLVADGHVFLSACYNVGAALLRTSDWSDVWRGDESLSSHYTSAVKVGAFLYGSHGRQEEGAELRCVEWKSGKVVWSKSGFGCAWLIAADGLLIAVRESGQVTLLEASPENYRERGSFAGFAPGGRQQAVRAAPALAGGVLFARDGRTLAAWRVGGN